MECIDSDFFALHGDVLCGQHGSIRGGFVSVCFDLHSSGNPTDSFSPCDIGDMHKGVIETGKDVSNPEDGLGSDGALSGGLGDPEVGVFLDLGGALGHGESAVGGAMSQGEEGLVEEDGEGGAESRKQKAESRKQEADAKTRFGKTTSRDTVSYKEKRERERESKRERLSPSRKEREREKTHDSLDTV